VTTGGIVQHAGADLFRAIARGVIALGVRDRLASLALPYPQSTQFALDRVVLTCLERGETPPTGVPDLISWCAERTAEKWPFTVSPDFVWPDARLVEPDVRMPTRTCAEVASDGPSGVVEQQALAVLAEVEAGATSPVLFRNRRDFLIKRTVVTRQNHMKMLGEDPAIAVAWKRVSHLYGPVPEAYVAEDQFILCPTCQLLALRSARGTAWCESEICPRDVAVEVRYDADDAQVLMPSLRLFLALPGRTERAVRKGLARVGVGTTLIKGGEGTYRFSVPVGQKQTMRVYDRVQPALLAARAAEESASLIIIPSCLLRLQPDYRSVFIRSIPFDADVSLVTDEELIAMAAGQQGDPQRKNNA
jgi:pPIWI_RE three-gene island domain Y